MRDLTESEKAQLVTLDTPVGPVNVLFPGNGRISVRSLYGRMTVNRVPISVECEIVLNEDGSIPEHNFEYPSGAVRKENPKEWKGTYNVSRVTRNKALNAILPAAIEYVRTHPMEVREGEIRLKRRDAAFLADKVEQKETELAEAKRVLTKTLADLHHLEGHA